MSDKIHSAQEATGPKYRAVRAADGEVRLWYRRNRKTWIGFSLFPALTERPKRRVFKSLSEAESFLAIAPAFSHRGPIPKEVFSTAM